MKKIGIILRKEDKDYTLKKTIVNVIKKYNCIPNGIVSDELDNIKDILNLCDGFILQGGVWYEDTDIDIVKYIYEKNKPVLGICLGMQIIGVVLGGKLVNMDTLSHQSDKDYVHEVKLNNNSLIYKIIGKRIIKVNSRHQDTIINLSNKYISGTCNNMIESIEDNTKDFFIGVQWHPELINDDNSKKIFDYYFKLIDKK